MRHLDKLLLILDFLGTLVFAVEGGTAGIKANLDALGIVVLAFTTAVGGGIIRDLLIGAAPPNAIRDWRYGAIAFFGAGVVFFLPEFLESVPYSAMMVLDAVGLSLFAVSGATKAIEFNIHPFIAVLMGTITGVGGGTIRDIFLAQVPVVLRADVYATAALAGALVTVIGLRYKWNPALVTSAGAAFCFVLRVVAVWHHWNLPKVMLR
jgi:uncharacterized membrane protein YeiH